MSAQDDPVAFDELTSHELFPIVYRELKELARSQLRRHRDHSLDTTELVHEAYFKVADLDTARLESRGHFLAITARAMRQVLVAAARKRNSHKRGGGERPATLPDLLAESTVKLDDVLVVDAALERLHRLDPRLSALVECRFFAGLTEDEAASALGLSLSTVQRDWRRARAWLLHYLKSGRLKSGRARAAPEPAP